MLVHKPSVAESIIGHFDRCDGGWITGWAANKAAWDDRLSVEILVDGQPMSRSIAADFRPDLLEVGIGDGKHAFTIRLSEELCDGRDHTIAVREISSGLLLTGSPQTFRGTLVDRNDAGPVPGESPQEQPASDQQQPAETPLPEQPPTAESMTGFFEKCDGGWITGWAANKTAWDDRLSVEILVDGHPISRTMAADFRPDLLEAGIGDGKHAFTIRLSEELFDGREHTIEVREISTGLLLAGSPRVFQDTLSESGLKTEGVGEPQKEQSDGAAPKQTLEEKVASLERQVAESRTAITQATNQRDEAGRNLHVLKTRLHEAVGEAMARWKEGAIEAQRANAADAGRQEEAQMIELRAVLKENHLLQIRNKQLEALLAERDRIADNLWKQIAEQSELLANCKADIAQLRRELAAQESWKAEMQKNLERLEHILATFQ